MFLSFLKNLFIYFYFLAALGLSCGERGLLFIAVHRLLIAEHGL